MKLEDIKGLGKARIEALNNAGIFSPEDFLEHFPKKYYNFSNLSAFSPVQEYVMLKVKILEKPSIIRARGGLNFVQVKALDLVGNGEISLVWFNQSYLAKIILVNQTLYVYGKPSAKKKNTFNVSLHKPQSQVNPNEIFAVYKTFDNIGQATIKSCIKNILDNIEINGLIPEPVRAKYGIEPLSWAYNNIHFPANEQALESAQERIGLEQALVFATINNERRLYSKGKRTYLFSNLDEILKEYQSLLPWQLTQSQLKAIGEINADLLSKSNLNRMIEGDVGCGKTAVCLWAMFAAARNGYQAVLMAPTEILAMQHYEFFQSVLKNSGVKVALLTSSTTSSDRRDILDGLYSGEISIAVGTQSLISDRIDYKNLALAVVDEQHRFGVNCRAQLAAKGKNVDYLSLSATPIPRSVSLVLYGGLDLTRIDTRPNAVNIQTNLVKTSKEEDMWEFVRGEIERGRTAYVVCPKIDDAEESNLMSTTAMIKKLSAKFGKENVCELNGRIKEERKSEILTKFKAGEIKVLVSTTVVEVGVDCPKAGVIVIVNPEMFGLATLHQLRGRVSRDGQKSYCFILVGENLREKTGQRLVYFKNNNNGFDVADYDLANRGAGDAFGTRQHGEASAFSNINLSLYDQAQNIFEDIKSYPSAYKALVDAAETKYPQLIRDIVMN